MQGAIPDGNLDGFAEGPSTSLVLTAIFGMIKIGR